MSDPPQGNAIATIVNRNTVEPQPAIYHPVIRHVMPQQQAHQKLQQSTKIRASVQQQQQFHQDVRPSQAPAMLASVGGVWQVRGKRGRGTVRGCSVGRGQQGVLHQPQLVSVPPSQQEMKREPTAKVTHKPLVAAARFFSFPVLCLVSESCCGYHGTVSLPSVLFLGFCLLKSDQNFGNMQHE